MSIKDSRQKLWIVTELFFPDETATSFILTKIANKLCDKYDVGVICASSFYDKANKNSSFSFKINDLINIHRVKDSGLDKNNIVLRSINFVLLSFSLSFALIKRLKAHEKVLIVTNPAPLLIFISILRMFKTFNFIVLVHDVFPENTVPAGVVKSKKNHVYKVLKILFDKAYSKADSLIVIGRDMKHVLENKTKGKTKIVVIENWADTLTINPEKSAHSHCSAEQQPLVFQYAGNLGRAQGLLPLLKLIKNADNPDLCFFFIGDGAVKQEMLNYVAQNELTNIRFQENYARDQQNLILNQCDIAIVTLASGMYGLGVPSKTYNILAAGKPILFIGDKQSEVGRLIEESRNGFCFDPAESHDLLFFLKSINSCWRVELEQMGRLSRALAEKKYSEDIILSKFLDVI